MPRWPHLRRLPSPSDGVQCEKQESRVGDPWCNSLNRKAGGQVPALHALCPLLVWGRSIVTGNKESGQSGWGPCRIWAAEWPLSICL